MIMNIIHDLESTFYELVTNKYGIRVPAVVSMIESVNNESQVKIFAISYNLNIFLCDQDHKLSFNESARTASLASHFGGVGFVGSRESIITNSISANNSLTLAARIARICRQALAECQRCQHRIAMSVVDLQLNPQWNFIVEDSYLSDDGCEFFNYKVIPVRLDRDAIADASGNTVKEDDRAREWAKGLRVDELSTCDDSVGLKVEYRDTELDFEVTEDQVNERLN